MSAPRAVCVGYLITTMISDLRFAARQLMRNPAFSLIAILSLALGIGATTSVFTIINGTLLRTLPYRQPEQLVFITPEKLMGGATNATISGKQFAEWEKDAHSFAGLAAYDWTFTFLVHPDGNESIQGMLGSASLFRVLGIHAMIGRTFTEEETSAEPLPVVLLGYDLWQRRFGGDKTLVGKTIQLNRLPPLTVVGIMPPGLRFLPSRGGAQEPNYNLHDHVDFWLPAAPKPTRGGRWNVVGRLNEGVTLQQARVEMTNLSGAQLQADPRLAGTTAIVTPIAEVLDGEIRRVVLPLFGAVCLVLFIAIANVGGLLLVRGLGRQRELAVRTALGASWLRLLRLTLTESFLLAAIGGVFGVLVAFGVTKLLLLAAPKSIPRLDDVVIDLRVLAFAVGVSLLTALCSGALAAWQILKPDINQALKAGNRGGTQGSSSRRMLGALVAGELALTLTILIGAGLMIQTTMRLTRLNPGYETNDIVTMVVTSLKPNIFEFHKQALEGVSALPGVTSAAFVWGLPLTGNFWRAPITIEGRPPPANPQDRIFLPLRSVTPDYFRLMGISLQRGRLIENRDQANSGGVAIINQEMARRYFPDENPVGKHLSLTPGKPLEIVGVVSDLRNRALDASLEPEVYLAFFQSPAFSKHLVVRTKVDPLALVAAVRHELQQIDPGVVIERIKTMERIRGESVAAQNFAMTLISAFSVVALALALIGIYGVMSYSVAQRAHEFAIRMAIGASQQSVLRLILKEGLFLALIGIAFGLAGAAAATRVLHTLLFEITATDPLTFAVVVSLLVLATLFASWLPARRATKVDPMLALRSE
jgi:putative ABC transport system permease protein